MIQLIKKLSRCVREYKKPAILTLCFIIGEAEIEAINKLHLESSPGMVSDYH